MFKIERGKKAFRDDHHTYTHTKTPHFCLQKLLTIKVMDSGRISWGNITICLFLKLFARQLVLVCV